MKSNLHSVTPKTKFSGREGDPVPATYLHQSGWRLRDFRLAGTGFPS